MTGSLAADGVDLTVDDGDDLCQRQTDGRQTEHTHRGHAEVRFKVTEMCRVTTGSPVWCRVGGGVTGRRPEELCQVVEKTREAPVQTGAEDGGEVWTEVAHTHTDRHSGLQVTGLVNQQV